ncbi:P-loop containing nucleoside triphosphate hydrolase protein [Amylostereum chailletii]|nr:P-loop containing nucleoside triphosphate hydrolase protein [Amylostereum chailletii]
MPRHARIHFTSLKSSLVNLPISLYGPLVERNIRPQQVGVVLSKPGSQGSFRQDIYVGWTGMVAASSVARFTGGTQQRGGELEMETVEIDPQFASGLGFLQGDIVEIGLLHDLPRAKMIEAEPLTADDWEIIELHADHVEGTLLSQVRVAAGGQEVDVWVLGRTRVRLRVTSLDPPHSKALLLTTDTEVAVAPKARRPPGTATPSLNSAATALSKTVSPSQPPTPSTYSAILRVLPAHLVDGLPEAGPDPVVCVSPALLSRASYRGRLPDNGNNAYTASLQVLKGPSDPEETSSSTPPIAETKILDLGKNPASSSVAEKARSKPMSLIGIDSIPEGQTVVVGGMGSTVGDMREWDVVRLTISAGSESSRASPRPKLLRRQSGPTPVHTLAGIDDLLASCTGYCKCAFDLSAAGRTHGVDSLLVAGRPGAGKTEVARAVAQGLQINEKVYAFSRYVDLSRYKDKPVRNLKDLFVFWKDKASWHHPSVLVFDNLDSVVSAEVEHADSFRARHIAENFVDVFVRGSSAPGVVVIATASSQAALHTVLSTLHMFKKVVALKPPDKNARKEILEHVIKNRIQKAEAMSLDHKDPVNIVSLATETEGYSATDLKDLVGRAVHQAAMRISGEAHPSGETTLSMSDFKHAKEGFVPLSLRDVPLQTSTVAWEDIGGLNETRRVLRETLEWPTKYAQIFKQSPLRLRSGLLLYGYPGCGKTLLASAVAKECGLNFISVKGPELLNKYIGASEKSVRDIFERASAAKPCVLFFDEFDSIAPKRGHDSTGVTDRVVNQLLTLMDGAEGLDGVYVLAATSRPDLIDSALLRPGRLDKSLLCNMPTAPERKEILQAHARKVPVASAVDFDYLADATEGFSGADLQALLYNAHLEVVHSDMHMTSSLDATQSVADEKPVDYVTFGGSQTSAVTSRAEQMAMQRRLRQLLAGAKTPTPNARAPVQGLVKHKITDTHLRQALKSARPSVSVDEIARLTRIYSAFVSDRSGDLPVPPDAGGVGQRASLM